MCHNIHTDAVLHVSWDRQMALLNHCLHIGFLLCYSPPEGAEDKDHSGRPKIDEDTESEELLEEDSLQTQNKLALILEVTHPGEKLLPHLPYSPDIAPSDYYLFQSMAHVLSEQRFTSYEDT
ncbi:Mariner Mos1 transposase [Eumeta japonica]|uniref:Mariner Mos1 transposase n=1 Tax=Eumeta variegata TaxID=151549 RepID=A0A4C1V2I4_EUMVA|nr:Mariner Mos1 transposase [Eumeta japonica]